MQVAPYSTPKFPVLICCRALPSYLPEVTGRHLCPPCPACKGPASLEVTVFSPRPHWSLCGTWAHSCAVGTSPFFSGVASCARSAWPSQELHSREASFLPSSRNIWNVEPTEQVLISSGRLFSCDRVEEDVQSPETPPCPHCSSSPDCAVLPGGGGFTVSPVAAAQSLLLLRTSSHMPSGPVAASG